MQCEKFESRLNQLLDERRQAERDDQLLAHASRCPDCQQMLATQQVLFDSQSPDSAAAASVGSPEALAERVLRAVASNPFPVVPVRPVAGRQVVRRLAWIAAAIVLVAGVSSAFQLISGDKSLSTGPVADSRSVKGQVPDSDHPSDNSSDERSVKTPSSQQISDEDRYRQWANSWGESVASGVMQISAADGGPMTEAIDARMDQFKSLRPLRISMAAAFDALRKTLPHIAQPSDDQAS